MGLTIFRETVLIVYNSQTCNNYGCRLWWNQVFGAWSVHRISAKSFYHLDNRENVFQYHRALQSTLTLNYCQVQLPSPTGLCPNIFFCQWGWPFSGRLYLLFIIPRHVIIMVAGCDGIKFLAHEVFTGYLRSPFIIWIIGTMSSNIIEPYIVKIYLWKDKIDQSFSFLLSFLSIGLSEILLTGHFSWSCVLDYYQSVCGHPLIFFVCVFSWFDLCGGMARMAPLYRPPYGSIFPWGINHGSFCIGRCISLRMMVLYLWFPIWITSKRECCCEGGLLSPGLIKILGAFSIYVSEAQEVNMM